jgi:hypothetical protein
VFDTTKDAFFLSEGGKWVNLSSSNEIWSRKSSRVFLTNSTDNIGIGTKTPTGKFVIQANNNHVDSDVLFEVKDKNGKPIFVVTSVGVRAFVKDYSVSGGISDPSDFSNTFVGDSAGFSNTTGNNNTFLGFLAGKSNTKGVDNVFVGQSAGYSNTTGNNNTAVGNRSLGTNTSGTLNTSLGVSTLQQATTGSYNTAVGGGALRNNITGNGNSALGVYCGYWSTGSYNAYFGYSAGFSATGSYNAFIGYETGYSTSGNYDVFIGYHAGRNNTIGQLNTAIGYRAMRYNTTGHYMTAIGAYALYNNTTGSENTAVGNNCLAANTTGYHNVAVGSGGLQNTTTGYGNATLGVAALQLNTEGDKNTAIGYSAGNGATGSGNVFLGYYAGYNETGSNTLYIENSGTSSPLIYGDFSSNFLRFNGYVDINRSDGGVLLQGNGAEALWYDGTYFSWGSGASYNYFADPVGIGFVNPKYKLQLPNNSAILSGQARAYAWTTYSDERVKKEQKDLTYGVNEIMKLQPKAYDHYSSEFSENRLVLNHDHIHTIGLIAQEVYEIIPEAVQKPEDDSLELWGLDYEKLIPVLICAIQEQQKEIDLLKEQNQRIEELERQLKALLELSEK